MPRNAQTIRTLVNLTFVMLVAASIPVSQAQSVVRLFSTPAERAALERQRLAQYRPDLQPAVTEPEPLIDLPPLLEPEVPDVIYRFGGSMQRSDGQYAIWLNGDPIEQDNLPDNMELLQPFAQGRLRVRHPVSGVNYEVKPGQVLNLTTGELFESYEFVEPVVEVIDAATSVTDSNSDSATLANESADSN